MKRNKFKKRSFLTLGAVMAIFASANYCPALAAQYNIGSFDHLKSSLENGKYSYLDGGGIGVIPSLVTVEIEPNSMLNTNSLGFGSAIDVKISGHTVDANNGTYSGSNTGFIVNGTTLTLQNVTMQGFDAALNVQNGGTVNLNGTDFNSAVYNNATINLSGENTFSYTVSNADGATVNNSGSATFNNGALSGGGKYVQSSADASTVLNGGSINADITGGSLKGNFSLTDGMVTEAVNTKINNDTTVSGGELTLDNKDTWSSDADITLNNNGTLNLSGVTQGGTLNAEGGSLNLNGTDLTISNGSKIAGAVNTQLNNGSLTVDGTGSVILNNGDTWNVETTLTNGSLTIDSIAQEASASLNATGGSLNLNGTDLTISTGSQIAGAVNTQLNSGSLTVDGTGSVTLNQGDAWNVETTLTNGSLTLDNITQGTNASLNATGGGLVVNSNLNMAQGSMIADVVNANVSGDLTVSGGDVVFNNGDTWNSDTTLTNGSLALDNMTRGNNASLTANSGNLTLGDITLIRGDRVNPNVNVTVNGDVILTNGANVALDSRDTLNSGSVTVESYPSVLSMGGLSTNENFYLNAKSGMITLSGVTLNNENDNVADGATVTINQSTDTDYYGVTLRQGSLSLNSTNDTWNGRIILNGENANLNLANVIQGENGSLNATNGNLTVNNITLTKAEDLIAEAVKTTVAGDFTVSNGEVILDGATDVLQQGTITLDGSGNLTMNDLTTTDVNLIAKDGTLNLNNVTLDNDNDYIHFDSDVTFNGNLNITKGTVELDKNDNLSQASNTINLNGENATLGVDGLATDTTKFNLEKGTLHIVGEGLTLNNTDDLIKKEIHTVVDGDLNINEGQVYLNNEDEWNKGTIHVATNGELQFENFNKSYGSVLKMDGDGSLTELVNSTVATVDASQITNGTINIDNTSKFVIQDGTTNLQTLNSSGVLSTLNSTFEDHTINTINVIGNEFSKMDNTTFTGDNRADFTIDLYARLRDYNQDSDTFTGTTLAGLGTEEGTINISDWVLRGNLRRQDAPIDRFYDFKIFNYENLDNVTITATDKETFTPIGYYRLFSNGDGNYTLGLTRYNKQVFRAQATTLAQYNNQLAIDDIVTSHFTLHNAGAYRNSNRFASATPDLGPYLYNQKDGGLWFKSYADIERLSMTQDLNVHNTAYGAIIGADLPVFDLEDGWKFIPTTYIGYNGAHQSFNDVSAYQNGGQLGFMGTFIKDNFVSSHTIYGGGYYNEMHVDGVSDETANWFWGTAHRAAYNWRIKNHFIIQPTAFISYNMFGEQNFHSEFGEMGMRSGMLNGVNVAPGINFIWADDDWSLYAGVQYMYNINEQVSGRAGNVYLPNLHMRHGYIQYGLGGTKTIKDNLASYAQVMFRNAGRTGVAFQIGLQYSFDLNEIIQKVTTAFKRTKNIANK